MALVLTRRPGEAIIVKGPEGMPMRRIYVVAVEGNVVRLAIEAPDYVQIIREELLDEAGRREWDLQQQGRTPPPRRVRKLPTVVIAMVTMGLAVRAFFT